VAVGVRVVLTGLKVGIVTVGCVVLTRLKSGNVTVGSLWC
jgi:hypothetical protein